MKLLVLAQTPPPVHGQSIMVRAMVEGLHAHGIAIHHVNLRLSRDHSDIGRWRPGKIFAVVGACLRAIAGRFNHRCDTLYYVPAPGKRGALYRDWLVMLLCRPFFGRLVLHFHNGGLSDWLGKVALAPERWLTRLLLGRADLAIVLTDSLRLDARALTPARIAVVPNGIADPGETASVAAADFRILFLGSVSREKGADDLLAATRHLRDRGVAATAVFAGDVAPDFADELAAALKAEPGICEVLGFVGPSAKAEQLSRCGCVCVPSRYPHEGQPLVALEALAADKPLVVSDWRGLPETVPPWVPVIPPGDAAALADALDRIRIDPPPGGAQRKFFLQQYTLARHLALLASAVAATES